MIIDISRHEDAMRRLCHEAIACVPEAWNEGRLTIAIDEAGLHYRLESDTNQTPATATQQLGTLCGELYVLMEMEGQQWSRCVISFTRRPDDSWNFNVNFTYPDSKA